MIAGGLGNLYDRLRFACVRDFLHPLPGVQYPFGIATPWSGRELWPYVSNLADLWLILGVGVLMVYLLRSSKQPAAAGDQGPLKHVCLDGGRPSACLAWHRAGTAWACVGMQARAASAR
ncbi:MAG: hypothetical protein KatS3mg103_0642 [Phycisphaerales bacterium]|nr:MAG: hypothetical protein KatS3mg103_0642 [Phycisphaerales bacterium]